MFNVNRLREFCLSFPDATEDMPWPEDLCFKVRGKIFVALGLSDGRFPRLSLKASPEKFHELLETEGISPAPYVGRYKWVQIQSSNLLPAAELESLIRQSYEMVASKAPAPKTRKVKTATKKSQAIAKTKAEKKAGKKSAGNRRSK